MVVFKNLVEKQCFFTCITINTIEQLQEILNSLQGKEYVFRGVKEAMFKCYTSAQFRTKCKLSQEDFDTKIISMIEVVRRNEKIKSILKKRSKDVSDFQYLSLLQHYDFGTTILDFSYKVNYAVFFALDGMSGPQNDDDSDIANYCSIYLFDKNNPNHLTIQQVFGNSMSQLERHHSDAVKEYGKLYTGVSEQTRDSYKHLPYLELKNIATGGLSIEGRYGGEMEIYSPNTGIYADYNIANERIDTQHGLFKLNPSSSVPYEEAAINWYSGMRDVTICLNIHKSLRKELEKEFLEPFNICSDTVYPNNKESRKFIRLLCVLPIDNELRMRKPAYMHCGTWKKLTKKYNKNLKKRERKELQ